MPRTAQQYENIREGKKKLIMRTALELFASKGFHATTISSIAEKAGISKGLLYNYFENKEDLMRSIIYEGLENLDKLMDPDKDGVLTSDEIEYMIDRFFALLQEDISFWRLYFTVFVQEPVVKLVEIRLVNTVKKYIEMFEAYFRSGGCEDPYAEAVLFGAMLDGIAMNYIANPGLFPVDKIKKRIIRKFK